VVTLLKFEPSLAWYVKESVPSYRKLGWQGKTVGVGRQATVRGFRNEDCGQWVAVRVVGEGTKHQHGSLGQSAVDVV
jgi:hypothetical protein